MTESQLTYYFERHAQGKLTDEERAVFAQWLQDPANKELVQRILDRDWPIWEKNELEFAEEIQHIETRVMAAIDDEKRSGNESKQRVHVLKTAWFRYAAAAILIVGAYLWFSNLNKPATFATTQPVPAKNDVPPGHDGAILTLADGKQVVLDSMGNGLIAVQNGTVVLLNNGQLAYDPSGNSAGDIAYNTMSTPKGRQFKVTLPDSTKVWLNAASSIHYPTVFSGDERKVEITGEVYFEVAKNAEMPFTVKVKDDAEIQVLGTHFNINAYENEAAVKTTLLEGSVRVKAYKQLQTLQPGQQAQITPDEKLKVVNHADVDKAIAWKNGYFNFNDADLYEVMRQLERWYDIEVVYASPVRPVEFRGKLQRDLSLAQILRILGEMKIKFRIEEGRKLIIES